MVAAAHERLRGAQAEVPLRLAAAVERRGNIGVALAIVALAILALPGATLGDGILFDRDIHLTWHAHARAFVAAFEAGEWPLWDPHFGFGQPHLANPQTQTLYPLTWLLLAMSAERYYTLMAVLHLALGGLGFARLARSAGGSAMAGLAAGGLFVLSGPALSLVNAWHQLCGAAWLPWAWLAAEAAWSRPHPARAARLAAVLGVQVLAGSGEMSLMTGLLVAALGLARLELRTPGSLHNRRLAASATLAVALTALLSAAQWLPTLELTRRATRGQMTSEMRSFWSVHPNHALQALLPVPLPRLAFDTTDPHLARETLEPFLPSLYLGLPALPLALAGLLHAPRRRTLLALLAGGLLLSLGRFTPVHETALALLPPLRLFRFPAKAMLLVTGVWCLLAAGGLDAWRQGRVGKRVAALAALTTAAAILGLAWLPASPIPLDAWPAFPARAATTAGALAGIVVLLGVAATWRREQPAPGGSLLATVALAAALADLLSLHATLNPLAPKAFFATTPPTVAEIVAAHAGGDLPPRVHVWDYALQRPGQPYPDRSGFYREVPLGAPPLLARAAGLQAYLYPFVPGRFGLDGSFSKDLFGLFPGPLHDLTLVAREAEGTPALADLLALGGVDFVLTVHDEGLDAYPLVARFPGFFREPLRLRRVPRPAPRAQLVSRWRVATGHAAYDLLKSGQLDPRHEAIVAEPPGTPPGGPETPGLARVSRRAAGHLVVEAEARQASLLVVSEAFDPNWRATIDAAPAPLIRANVAFRGLSLPAGQHRIEMRYRPASIAAGALASGLGLALAGLCISRREVAA